MVTKTKLSLKDLDLKDKKVLMRVDFNVPLDNKNNITDDTRIRAALPSIQYVLEQGGALILMSHLGRPKGMPEAKYSLAPCAKALASILGKPVKMAPNCVGSEVESLAQSLKPGEILLLENLRFNPAEEKPENDPKFAQKLAKLGDIYVNDAFGTAHRAHSSTVEITKYFPGKAAIGFLMEKEIEYLSKLLNDPARPFYAVIGGAKISSKIGVLKALLKVVDAIFIGGGMTYTFLKSQGVAIGKSLHEDDLINEAGEILKASKMENKKCYLPLDNVIAQEIKENAPSRIVKTNEGIPDNYQGVDIGPQTIEQYVKELKKAKTVFWNGPMGVFEIKEFAKGTNAIAHTLADLKGMTVVGGGESVAAVEAAGVADKISHISTGGGASLEFIEFGTLPGIEALSDV